MKKKQLKFKLGDVAFIEWEDHASGPKGWTEKDSAHHTVCSVESVGIVVYVGPNYLTLANSVEKYNGAYVGSQTIVRSCITRELKLKRPPKKD